MEQTQFTGSDTMISDYQLMVCMPYIGRYILFEMRDKINSILILTMNESTAGTEVSVDVPNLY